MTSIRRRLLVALFVALTVATVTALAASYLKAREDVDELFDYQLRQLAFSLRNQPFGGGPPGNPFALGHDHGADFITQVWDRAGTLLYYSRPGTDLPPAVRSRIDAATPFRPGEDDDGADLAADADV